MNDKCSNGFCKFDSYTTTNKIKYKNMYETLEHWNQYKLKKQMKPIKKFCEKKNLNKEFDKWMNKLITKNGITNY